MVNQFTKRQAWALASLGAMALLTACNPQPSDVGTPPADDTAVVENDPAAIDPAESATSFNLTAEGREFFLDGEGEGNPDLVVQQGDTVEVTLCVTGGTHDWVVDEFDVATDTLSAGGECGTVEFVADQVGEFEYYCSVGSHRAEGMVGRLVVE